MRSMNRLLLEVGYKRSEIHQFRKLCASANVDFDKKITETAKKSFFYTLLFIFVVTITIPLSFISKPTNDLFFMILPYILFGLFSLLFKTTREYLKFASIYLKMKINK